MNAEEMLKNYLMLYNNQNNVNQSQPKYGELPVQNNNNNRFLDYMNYLILPQRLVPYNEVFKNVSSNSLTGDIFRGQ